MKILHAVLSQGFYGSERYCGELAAEQARDGHDVEVLIHDEWSDCAREMRKLIGASQQRRRRHDAPHRDSRAGRRRGCIARCRAARCGASVPMSYIRISIRPRAASAAKRNGWTFRMSRPLHLTYATPSSAIATD